MDKYKKITNGITTYYGWLRCPVSDLDNDIPQEVLDKTYGTYIDEDGNEVSTLTGLTLKDFVLSINYISDTEVIIPMSAKRNISGGRGPATSLEDFEDWINYITPHGYTIDDVMTSVEYHTLIADDE